ncbi:hypothetical protein HYPSUDRAFT_65728 [Hypholoma sublateritium FD-334 SS-4]|uniref:Uncharacterized protein n=1 Tax=Hypholoma sublateritium (strain FD-334 SS-4) TaxID=945553 RepID=A0A0D2P005_HYPSF|nr:hypothetical protein HYPSUDRAFT_65728 [Hypholoma sublateritium FD-334 SS-4]
MPPPPPPTAPPPMHPPQPLPQVPQGLRLVVPPPPPPEPSKEEKAALWEERIKLFSESTKAHERCDTLQEEYDTALRATKSTLFESLRTEDQERLRGQLAELARRRDDAQATYQTLRGKLLDTPSWPVAPPPAAREDHERHIELVKYVSELNDTVATMKGLLGEIMPYSYKQPPEPPALSDGELDGRMDVDTPVEGAGAGAQGSRKRQRVDDAADDTERRNFAQHDPDMPTQQELDQCREQLVVFEDQVKSLRNEIAQYELDNAANMAHIVSSKAQEIEAARQKEQRVRDRERRERDAAMRAKIAESQEKVAGCESDITEMAVDVANMMSDVHTLQIELDEETRKRDESRQKMLQLEERLQGYIATQKTTSATLDTLRTALKAYTTRPPSPPMSPAPVAAPYLLETLREPLLDAVRNEMRPLVEQMRTNVEELVAEKNKLVFEATWTKLGQTLHVLMKIKDRLMENQNQAGQPQPQPQLP